PGSPAYQASPPPFNARFRDVRPAAIVSCAGPQDVAEAIAFAGRHRLELVTRAGGHSFAGHSSTRGMLIDVTPMRSVTVADGVATVGAGARLGEVYEALQAHGLAIPGGTCPPVGVAGLTLGGGLGILGRKYGVTADHLVAAEVVLADGRALRCDDHHEQDLFWALRGAGAGNFGVVTSLVFRPVPAPSSTTNFHLAWPYSHAAAAIGAWQRWAPAGPDGLAASLKVTAGDDPGRPPTVDVWGAFHGPRDDAARLAGELVDRVGVDPAAATLTPMSWPETRRFWAELGDPAEERGGPPPPRPPEAQRLYARSEFFARPLPPDAVGALLAAFVEGRAPGESRELDFMPWGGAYNRRPADATAFVHRDQLFQLKHAAVVSAEAPPARQAAAHRAATRLWASVHPWGSGRVFQNFADPDLEDWADAYYGTNYPRLVRVKARYDPSGRFRFQQSLPAG
ncbi:MAG TPA: FAD-binding oxidoreductase, partial [Actinomycetes bacterium]|nr:FAD-binding oxidoreductase [Actinomycetes bacterium]